MKTRLLIIGFSLALFLPNQLVFAQNNTICISGEYYEDGTCMIEPQEDLSKGS